uniref:Protein twisted gastrulation n=1 Tax=Clastoptera arizonana TaxID=38151 RepID=A0A1B6CSQ7_9HEMI
MTILKMNKCFTFLICAITSVIFLCIQSSYSCNEAVCASIVSKCMITQSCKCDLKNCSCCKECFSCLSYLYSECCSCVDMCPKPNYTSNALSRKSHVEELKDEALPSLFHELTAEPDPQERWLTFTFPVDFEISVFHPLQEKEFKYRTQTVEQEVAPLKNVLTLNCSVAYMSQCMSWNKCKTSCISMGAVSYRWFHDGCCECIGDKCRDYGINESRCLQCPLKREVSDDEATYGEDDEALMM